MRSHCLFLFIKEKNRRCYQHRTDSRTRRNGLIVIFHNDKIQDDLSISLCHYVRSTYSDMWVDAEL